MLGEEEYLTEGFFTFCMVGAAFVYLVLHGYLFEIQPRYANHLWMMMFWCYPLSQQVIWDFFKKICRRTEKIGMMSFLLMGFRLIVLLISLLADLIGIGGYPGFGWKQLIGRAIGIVFVITGLILKINMGTPGK